MYWDPRPEPPTQRSALRRTLLELAAPALRPFARPRSRGSRPPRILLVRPDNIGDILLTSPALDLIQRSLPEAEVVYLVGPWARDAAAGGPLGHRLRVLPFPGFSRQPKGNLLEPYRLLLAEARRLRADRFDLAVLFRPDHWWGALLALAAGVPVRVGYRTPETAPLLTDSLHLAPGTHAVEQGLRLAEQALTLLGAPLASPDWRVRFDVTAADEVEGGRLLQERGLGHQSLAVLHPGAGAPLKSWPVHRWTLLLQQLRTRGFQVLLSGGSGEEPLLQAISQPLGEAPPMLVGEPLGTLAAVLRRAAVAVGPDSGIMHLAAAVGTPTVRLYGPAPPAVFGPDPTATNQKVLLAKGLPCVPCGSLTAPPCGARHEPPCMLALEVDSVLGAIDETLTERGGARA